MSSPTFDIKDLPVSAHHIRSSLVMFGIKIGLLLLFYFVVATTTTILITLYLPSTLELSLTGPIIVLSFLEIYLIAQGVLFGIAFISIILIILSWTAENAYLSSTHLITYRGLFTLDEDIYELNHIKAVKLHQSFFGKMFRYGNLKIMFASSGYHEEVILKNLANPKLYERALKEHEQISNK